MNNRASSKAEKDESLESESAEHVVVARHVQSIATAKFQGRSLLTTVELPVGLQEIQKKAFNHCLSLVDISIPSSVQVIGKKAFSDCYALEEMNIPEGIAVISSGTFASCGMLRTVQLPTTVVRISSDAFSYCAKLTIQLPPKLTRIGNRAFLGCSRIQTLLIPSTVVSLGDSTFASCTGLKSIEVCTTRKSALTEIGGYVFSKCQSLINVAIPNKKGMEIYAFVFHNTRFNDERDVIKKLQNRFKRFPVHRLCYNQGHGLTSNDFDNRAMYQGKRINPSVAMRDDLGLTVFHILALSEKASSIAIYDFLKRSVRVDTIGRCLWLKDNDGNLALAYSIFSTESPHSQSLARSMTSSMIAPRLSRSTLEQSKNELLQRIRDETMSFDYEVVNEIFHQLSMIERKESIILLLLALWKQKMHMDGLRFSNRSSVERPSKRQKVSVIQEEDNKVTGSQEQSKQEERQSSLDRWNCYLRAGADDMISSVLSFVGQVEPELQLQSEEA
ncbi:unnamed protein product [Cylindrotheca closterium]|uniref:Uncharacterized protein n=1 Tax=Cylindrotheca closterium TaxID=2856 RepID=A0AAD2FY85_9STRA|nr:unnamed protein product [Cylindrotheca closterium]